MADSVKNYQELILHQCAEAAPNPWYPSAYTQSTGTSRDKLDPDLDHLRMAGLIHLTDWVQGHGQGYALTPEGQEIVESPRLLGKLRTGRLKVQREEPRHQLPPDDIPIQNWERSQVAERALTVRTTPVVTFSLICLNVLVFLVGMAIAKLDHVPTNIYMEKSTPRVLQLTGAASSIDIYLRGQWWRLLTCCFVHVGLLHLAANMFSLYMVGRVLERLWGPFRFLVLYLLAGFAGSCFGIIEHLGFLAGASGACLGIMGSFATWIFLNRNVLPGRLIASGITQLLIVLMINLYVTFQFEGISKGGHLGGLGMGVLAAVPLDYLRFGTTGQRLLALVTLVALTVACFVLLNRSLEANRAHILAVEESREIADLNQHYLPRIRDAGETIRLVWMGRARKLCQDDPPRDPDAVRTTLAALSAGQHELTQTIDSLDKAGPYLTPFALDVQKTARDYVAAYAEVFEEAKRCLQQGENWTDKDVDSFEKKADEALKARQQWLKVLTQK